MTAKDSGFTVESVEKDADGSYDVRGTKDGSPMSYDVSADLKTITERTGGPGMGGPHGGMGPGGVPGGQQGGAQQGGTGQQGTTLPGAPSSATTAN